MMAKLKKSNFEALLQDTIGSQVSTGASTNGARTGASTNCGTSSTYTIELAALMKDM